MIEKEITTSEEARNFLEKIVYQISFLRDFEEELDDRENLLKKYEKTKGYFENKFQIDVRRYDDILKNLENEKYNLIN